MPIKKAPAKAAPKNANNTKAGAKTQAIEMELVSTPKAHATKTGLAFEKGIVPTLKEYEEIGHQLASMSVLSAFMLGDWLNYGTEHYPRDYKKAVEATGMSYGTLRNYASVAAKYPMDKRLPGLTFDHHRLAAPVLDDAKRLEILENAEEKGLSSAAMSNTITDDMKKAKSPRKAKDPTKLAQEQGEKIKELAEYIGGAETQKQYLTLGDASSPGSPIAFLTQAIADYEDAVREVKEAAEVEKLKVAQAKEAAAKLAEAKQKKGKG